MTIWDEIGEYDRRTAEDQRLTEVCTELGVNLDDIPADRRDAVAAALGHHRSCEAQP